MPPAHVVGARFPAVKTPLTAVLASSIALFCLGVVGCGGNDGGDGSGATGSPLGGEVEGSDGRGGTADGSAPPFSFAGSDSSEKVDDEFSWPAEAGEGQIAFADGREAAIELTSCSQFTSDRTAPPANGRGEMADGQRFRLAVERQDGAYTVTLITTRDPAVVAEDTAPVWSSLDVAGQIDGLELKLRDFWLLATVDLEEEEGPRVVSTPANFAGFATERMGSDISDMGKAEFEDLLSEFGKREAGKGFAAEVESLALRCTDG
jgi:hypothetical protein